MKYYFNLFLLNQETDKHPRTWICLGGSNLKKIVDEMEEEISKKYRLNREKISKIIGENISISFVSIKNILRGKVTFYSIPVILEMSNLSGKPKYYINKIQNSIEYLKVNSASSKPIKASKKLSSNLAKIIGAFCADGSLSIQIMIENTNKKELKKIGKILNKKEIKKSSARNKYYISITINKDNQNKILKLMKDNKRFKIQSHFNIELADGHKSNVEAFNKWIYKEFKIKPISFYERKNSWRTIFSNKILARYLMCFFDFNPSYKSRDVKEPKIIKKSDLKIRKEFAKGVLMFDGCITKGKKIMFSTKSSYLAESIKDILNKDNLKIGFFKNKRKEYTVYTTSKNNSSRLLNYFEKGTKKWDLLKWLIHKNFKSKKIDYSKDIKFAKNILDLLNKIKSADSNYLMKEFNCSHTTIREKLKILDYKDIIRLTKHPKNISNYISKETTVFLKRKFHNDLFYQILKKFNSYEEFSRFLGIHKATLSAWKIKKNRIPLKIIKSICESLEIPFDIALKNVYETNREIAEVI